MAAKYNKKRPNYFARVYRQKSLIEKNFECFECRIKGRGMDSSLECFGKIQPTDLSIEYTINLTYDGHGAPRVYVIDPELPYDIDAHMYSDKRLCLYYPEEDPWAHYKSIADTVIPWTAEWLVYYELYQIDGKWHGPFVPHDGTEKHSD
ncbi:MAG: hypothetical protein WD604_08165 [Balneolaceae bacterium]